MATGYARCSRRNRKKIPETDAIFANLNAKDSHGEDPSVLRVSMDCKVLRNVRWLDLGQRVRSKLPFQER